MADQHPTLTQDEIDALADLDKSIGLHDAANLQTENSDDEDKSVNLTDDEDNTISINVPHTFQPFKMPAIPEAREAESTHHAVCGNCVDFH